MWLSIVLIVVVLILFLIAFLLIRTLMFAKPFVAEEPVELEEVEAPVVAEHLASIIQCETVSMVSENPAGRRAFYELQLKLHEMYPRLHATLEQQIFNDFTLLYAWRGKNPDLPPAVLMAHQDVVPAATDSLDQWEYPPFSGAIADGFVWGRGTLDVKGQVIGLMESVEALLKTGYQPERTIYLAFGHDEEIGGTGCKAVVDWFAVREIRPGIVLDEGGQIAESILPDVSVPVAVVGTAEKGTLVVELSVEAEAGHSAFPPRQTAIGALAQGLAFLEHEQMPTNLKFFMQLIKGVAAAMPYTQQLALANLWLFGGGIKKRLEANPITNAMIRTTTATTVIQAGDRPNMLPGKASALINFRLLPGDTIAGVCDHVRKVVDDPRLKLEVNQSWAREASSESLTEVPSFQLLGRTIRQVFENAPVCPYLVLAATDARYYHEICDEVYRFTPLVMTSEDIHRVHGLNERVSIDALGKMVQFYIQLLKSWGEDF
ncbi:MAG TPA: M20/M25/M40 family metallo-hydrolase [Anaerolineaceae bacterium]|nr:M20/M25/M40 family metallo-hydrolase [Anaerolineaceae bacterium]